MIAVAWMILMVVAGALTGWLIWYWFNTRRWH